MLPLSFVVVQLTGMGIPSVPDGGSCTRVMRRSEIGGKEICVRTAVLPSLSAVAPASYTVFWGLVRTTTKYVPATPAGTSRFWLTTRDSPAPRKSVCWNEPRKRSVAGSTNWSSERYSVSIQFDWLVPPAPAFRTVHVTASGWPVVAVAAALIDWMVRLAEGADATSICIRESFVLFDSMDSNTWPSRSAATITYHRPLIVSGSVNAPPSE